MQTKMLAYTHGYTHTHIHRHRMTKTFTYTHTHIHIHTFTHVHTHMHACVHTVYIQYTYSIDTLYIHICTYYAHIQ